MAIAATGIGATGIGATGITVAIATMPIAVRTTGATVTMPIAVRTTRATVARTIGATGVIGAIAPIIALAVLSADTPPAGSACLEPRRPSLAPTPISYRRARTSRSSARRRCA